MEGKMATGSKSRLTSDAMDEKYRNILKSVKVGLVKDMDPEEVLLHMSSARVFSERDEEAIRAEKTRERKCEILLSILPRKGAKAYMSFVQALEEVQTHLAKLILDAEIQEINRDPTSESHPSAVLPVSGSQSCLRCRQFEEKFDLEKKAMKQEKEAMEQEKEAMKQEKEAMEQEKEAMKQEKEAMKQEVAELKLKHKNEVEQYKKDIAELKKVTPQKKSEKAKKRDPKR